MGHYVMYVADLPGSSFQQRVLQAVDPKEIAELREQDLAFETSFDTPGTDYSVNPHGQATVFDLPVKYSRLESDRDRVRRWETAYRRLLPHTATIRIDEFVLDRWTTQGGGSSWHHRPNAFEGLLNWLEAHFEEGWSLLP